MLKCEYVLSDTATCINLNLAAFFRQWWISHCLLQHAHIMWEEHWVSLGWTREKKCTKPILFHSKQPKRRTKKREKRNKVLALQSSATGCILKLRPSAPHRCVDWIILVRQTCYLLPAAFSVSYISPWRKG